MADIAETKSQIKSQLSRAVFGIALLSTVTIVTTNVIVQTFNTVHKLLPLDVRMVIFILSIIVYSICQYIVLRYVKHETSSLFQSKATIRKIHHGIKIIQLFFIVEALFLIFQLVTESKYNLIIIILSTIISYSSASLLMLILSFKLFRWISRSRNRTVLLYAISALLLAFNIMSSLIYENISIFNLAKSIDINGFYIGDYPGNNFRHAVYNLAVKYLYLISSIGSFVANWLAAVSLLRNYSTGIPTIVFWILMITPLFIFTSQYTPFLVAILKQILVTPGEIILGYTITSTIGESLGGILIGISFWITGRTINNFRIKNYMYISAVGYILLFSSNYAINASSPSYPPFGLVGILYVALSAYLVFIGIYSAAISMAHNNELRRFVEKSVKKEGILGNIGTSEKFLEIEKNVVGATKKLSHKLKYETGIEPALNEGEIKKYVSEVISEIKK